MGRTASSEPIERRCVDRGEDRMSNGKIVQVMGPVVDVEFESGDLPEVMTALKTTNPAIDDRADNLIIEVALHLGEKTVRCDRHGHDRRPPPRSGRVQHRRPDQRSRSARRPSAAS